LLATMRDPEVKKSSVLELAKEIRDANVQHPCYCLENCANFLKSLYSLMFQCPGKPKPLEAHIKKTRHQLHQMLEGKPEQRSKLAGLFFDSLPEIYRLLILDAKAVLDGDPAARSTSEIISAYPGFYATFVHRAAHLLFQHKQTLLARMLSEYAHRETGIDIHPGATIGKSFCIDHGTGIVIGETCVIGNGVKIYQGVTLGGLSVYRAQAGNKRHPSIGDDVVIYANATILGGQTLIGKGSIIGANVWLTESVAENSKVFHQPKITIQTGKKTISKTKAKTKKKSPK
jgi:serine O-acetyltransferase